MQCIGLPGVGPDARLRRGDPQHLSVVLRAEGRATASDARPVVRALSSRRWLRPVIEVQLTPLDVMHAAPRSPKPTEYALPQAHPAQHAAPQAAHRAHHPREDRPDKRPIPLALPVGERLEEWARWLRMAPGERVRSRPLGMVRAIRRRERSRWPAGPRQESRQATCAGRWAHPPSSAPGRGPARRRPGSLTCSRFRIGVGEDLLDHRRVLDAGDDAHRPAAHRAGFDVNAEHALEALCPSHRRPALGRGALVGLGRCLGSSALAPPGLRHLRPVGAVRGEHAVEADEIDSRFGHQRSEPGDEIQRLEEHVRGAVAVGRLERVAHQAARCVSDSRSSDTAGRLM